MDKNPLHITVEKKSISLDFSGELTLYNLTQVESLLRTQKLTNFQNITINLQEASYLDTAFALFLTDLQEQYKAKVQCEDENFLHTLALTKEHKKSLTGLLGEEKRISLQWLENLFMSHISHLLVLWSL